MDASTTTTPPTAALVESAHSSSSQTMSTPAVTTSSHLQTQTMEALKDIGFGSIAGVVSKTLEYPFDTVKVRLQSQPDHLPLRYKGPLDCFRQSIHAEGVRGLYRGVSAPLVGAMAENATLFFAYRVGQDLLRSAGVRPEVEGGKLPLPALISAGMVAGAVTSLVLTPIELVKCKMQVPEGSAAPSSSTVAAQRLRSPFAIIASVWRHDGLLGFWRGQLGTFLRETGGGAAWFGSYEALSAYFKRQLRDPGTESLPVYQQMIAGAAAGMSYNFAFYPADTIKSKMQTEIAGKLGSSSAARETFMSVGKELYRTHGIRGLYRGCGLTVARSAPSSALIFTIYEALRNNMG